MVLEEMLGYFKPQVFKKRNGVEIMLVKCMFSGSGGQGSALMVNSSARAP